MTLTVNDPGTPPITCSATGNISFEKWNDVSGTNISDIPLGTDPDETGLLNEFNIPTNVGSNYAMRLRGFICPPETGEYTFWIASDDQGALFLSTDADPGNKAQIAGVPSWSPFQDWDKNPEQQSEAITLQAGQKYYIEALFKEAGGGDHMSVAWRLPSENFNLPGGPIPGQYLSPFDGSAPAPNQPPTADLQADVVIGDAPLTVNFDASGSGDIDGNIVTYEYDFDESGNPQIDGATTSNTFENAGTYAVMVTVTDNEGATDVAMVTITVTDPNTPPANVPPTADLQADVVIGDAPLTVNFDASGSGDIDGNIVTYEYDFDEGGNPQIGGTTISNTFEDPGTYVVTLTVTDDDGATDQTTVTLTVTDPDAAVCSATGNISYEKWNNVSGTNISDIPLGTDPDETGLLSEFNIPTNVGSNYGMRLRGFICPPETGEYTFWIASDDQGALFLSTDADPGNKAQIAGVPSWSPFQDWDKNPEQESEAITLQAGQKYYIEALFKEAGGGDHMSVAWRLPSESFNLPTGPIPGEYLSHYDESSFNLNASSSIQVQTEGTEVTESGLQLFPNPASDRLNVMLTSALQGSVSVEIADVQGRTIRTEQWEKEERVLTRSLNVGDLPEGNYLMRILQEDQVIMKRFVKR